jgi:hypothetical protein
MKTKKRQIFITMGGIFGAGLVHSLLPPGNIWIRAALTAAAAILSLGLFAWLFPQRPDA